MLRAVDLFCGAGGTSQGARQSGAAKVVCAVNHWDIAVKTHSANFADTLHINSRIDQVNPGECPPIDLLFASPECTHHSRARGGMPTSDQQRSGAWDIMRWIDYHRPRWVIVENVSEFREWGPVGDHGKPLKSFRGRFFAAWLEAIRSAGYRVDHELLNAADFGAATSRTRLFVVARKGNRSFHWPEPTHGKKAGGELPGMRLKAWRPAYEIIDWSVPCPSVFLRTRPLKDKTLARIEAGLRKFVGPFVATMRSTSGPVGSGGTTRPIVQPIGAITAGGTHHGVAVPFQYKVNGNNPGLTRSVGDPVRAIIAADRNEGMVVPFLYQMTHGGRIIEGSRPVPTITTANRGETGVAIPFIKPNFNEREGQLPRSHGLSAPIPAVTSRGAGDLIVPYVVPNEGFYRGNQPRGANEPTPTITSRGGGYVAVPIVVTYYANGRAQPVTDPLGTITTRDRCGLAMAIVETCPNIGPRSDGERKLLATMRELGVADVGFRMFLNRELSLAQGFPGDYIFHGNKGDVTRQIGNSVSPDVAEALTRAAAEAA